VIKTIHIKNFLSLRDVNVTLGETNVCVGANMTGKSALIKALKFLGFLTIYNFDQVVREFGGFSEVLWKGGVRESISFHLKAEYGREFGQKERHFEYYLEFAATSLDVVSIQREKLFVGVGSKRKILLADLKNGVGPILHPNGKEAFKSPGPTNSILHYDVPGWEGTNFRNVISKWRFYDINPASMKNINPVVRPPYLNGNGDNLANWLLTLQTAYRPNFLRILQAARDALPGFSEVTASITQVGTTFIKSKEEHLLRDVTVLHMSDGELKYLALLSLILSPPESGAPLFAIEEPDTNLHPRLLESLITVFNQFRRELGTSKAQVLMTTHSPQLVDLTNPEDLLVFEKQKGATIVTRPSSKKHLKKLLTEGELSLGELFFS